jgi:hypothetical protein
MAFIRAQPPPAFPSPAESFSLLSFCSGISNLMTIYLPIQPDLLAELWTLGQMLRSGCPGLTAASLMDVTKSIETQTL